MNPYAPSASEGTSATATLGEKTGEHVWILFAVAWGTERAILDASDEEGLQFWQDYCPCAIGILRSETAVLLACLLVYCTTWIGLIALAIGLVFGIVLNVVKTTIMAATLIHWSVNWLSTRRLPRSR